jgi:hypothetical protein
MTKKPSYLQENVRQLEKLCAAQGYEISQINEYQYRVCGATHIIDIWPSRMKYHRIGGESINSNEHYLKLDTMFNKTQVDQLLRTGKFDG